MAQIPALALALLVAISLVACAREGAAPTATPAAAANSVAAQPDPGQQPHTAPDVAAQPAAASAEPQPTSTPVLPPGDDRRQPGRAEFSEFVQANFSQAAAAASAARGLERDLLEPQIVTPDAAAAEVAAALARQDAEEVGKRDLVLQLLGVLAPGQSLDEVYLELVPDQVIGFYLAEDDRLFVVEPVESTPTQDDQTLITLAHEYIHALQQAHFDIEALGEAIGLLEFDRGLALSALIEGDASVFGLTAVVQQVDLRALQSVEQDPLPDLGRAGDFVQQMLLFPYVAGAEFVLGVLLGAGLDGLNGLYAPAAVPLTTAEVTPLGLGTEFEPSDAAEFDAPRLPCWELQGRGSLGQFMLGALLGGRIESGARGPDGWTDDHLLLLGNGAADMLMYRAEFAESDSAAAFFADLQDLIASGGLDHAGRAGSIAETGPAAITWQLEERVALARQHSSSVTLVVGDHDLAVTGAAMGLGGDVVANPARADYCPAQ